MKNWKHINFKQRKTICSCVAHNYKVKDIGELLDLDPTSISKEVKRNRVPMSLKDNTESSCEKLKRWSYVCNNCKNRYGNCPYVKFTVSYFLFLILLNSFRVLANLLA